MNMTDLIEIDAWRQYQILSRASTEVRTFGDFIQLCAHKAINHPAGWKMRYRCAYCALAFIVTDADIVVHFPHDTTSLCVRVARDAGLDWLRDMEAEIAT